MATYTPHPIDTSHVALPDSILQLQEHLAENAHEVWAQQRIAQGWTFGTQRDDAAKQHPCLIPYADLPDSEKEYDRATALQTLKLKVRPPETKSSAIRTDE